MLVFGMRLKAAVIGSLRRADSRFGNHGYLLFLNSSHVSLADGSHSLAKRRNPYGCCNQRNAWMAHSGYCLRLELSFALSRDVCTLAVASK